jgi:pectate lyase
VQTRVRPLTFGTTGDPWVGVMARFSDTYNYVYMSLRRGNTLTLRKVQGGNIVQLGSAVLTVTPNTWYTLRLDAVGSNVRAYVNGRLVLEATDPQPLPGSAGILTYRAAADYDDFRAVVP